jgi:hypothetical protein
VEESRALPAALWPAAQAGRLRKLVEDCLLVGGLPAARSGDGIPNDAWAGSTSARS